MEEERSLCGDGDRRRRKKRGESEQARSIFGHFFPSFLSVHTSLSFSLSLSLSRFPGALLPCCNHCVSLFEKSAKKSKVQKDIKLFL